MQEDRTTLFRTAENRRTPRLDLPAGTWIVLKVKTESGIRFLEGELQNMSETGFAVRVPNARENRLDEGMKCQILIKPSSFDGEDDWGEVIVRQASEPDGGIVYGITRLES